MFILVKLVPECTKCGSPVTDSVEPEVEEHSQVKRGQYVNSIWICNDSIENEEEEQKIIITVATKKNQ
jgi:hypothetical protein